MVLVVGVLAAGTIAEKIDPTVHIYTQWWFVVLMALVALAAIVSLVMGKMWRKPALLLIHAAVPVILLGGGLSTWLSKRGDMVLMPQVPTSTVVDPDNEGSSWELPFEVVLEDFEVVPYAGTKTPMDFVSRVRVEGRQHTISMNHILRHSGYRFYQSDYGTDGSSTLSVAHDPWGIAVTYLGYLLLLVGLGWLLVDKRGSFRSLMRSATVAALLLLPMVAGATPNTLPRETADHFGRMYMLYKGRVCPVQTFAKDFTTKLTGKATYDGLTAEQVLCGFLFYYDQWVDEPMLKIKGSGTWTTESGEHQVGRRASVEELMFLEWEKLSPTADKNMRAAQEKYNLVRMLSAGRTLKIFPVADSTGALSWYGQNDVLPMTVSDEEYLFIRRNLSYCQELVVMGDLDELNRVIDKTIKYQRQRAGDVLPSDSRVAAERLYNGLTTGRWLAMLCITLGLLAFAAALVYAARGRSLPRWANVACTLFVALLTLFLLLLFVLRWVAGGHVPMAGGFDSMNLMAMAMGVLGVVLALRRKPANSVPIAVAPIAMLVMGFCLLVAMMSGSNPPVTNLMPVLNSPLLTLHVGVIMLAYVLFMAVAVCSAAGLVSLRSADLTARLRRLSLLMLYPAVALLALGIMIGAVWANVSWGNYWSWDPKEVWALITLIVYAMPLHSSIGAFRKPWVFHLYCLLALLSVAITYFGVNLVLGGMHSYN